MLIQIGLGLAISAGIGMIAYQRQALSKSGVAGAILTGTIIFGFGGWIWGMLLITFFVLSTLLSKYKAQRKATLAEKFAKGSQRDIWQALANGGAGTLLALARFWAPHPALFIAFTGAMGAVNADTWATELGVLSKRPPRLITTGKPVELGTSGGISVLGTLATLAGGLAIGLAAALYMALDKLFGGPGTEGLGMTGPWPVVGMLLATSLGALAGSLCDSLLGATVQVIYYSQGRQKETEKAIDPDGSPNRQIRGWAWLNNDWVNFISSLTGALVSAAIWVIIM